MYGLTCLWVWLGNVDRYWQLYTNHICFSLLILEITDAQNTVLQGGACKEVRSKCGGALHFSAPETETEH